MFRLLITSISGVFMLMVGTGCSSGAEGASQQKSALRFKMKSLGGEEVDLAKYAGKVVMVVNVASKCGFTPQYEQLQELHEKYGPKGLAILGFPCNQFLGQEPGTAEQIRQFCRSNYGATFDMFAKVEVNGETACDLYRLLTSLDTEPKGPGKVGWNFEKFILDRNGIAVARFGSTTRPDAQEILAVIERELAREAAPRDAGSSGRREGGRTLDLADFRWKNRLVLLFAPSGDDKVRQDFLRIWVSRAAGVSDRDLVLVEILEEGGSRADDTLVSAASAATLRRQFQIAPGSTTLVLIGKDGTEKLRKTALQIDELFNVIDAMPMRKQEMQRQKQGG